MEDWSGASRDRFLGVRPNTAFEQRLKQVKKAQALDPVGSVAVCLGCTKQVCDGKSPNANASSSSPVSITHGRVVHISASR